MIPLIFILTEDELIIMIIAHTHGCTGKIAQGAELQSDDESTWRIGDVSLPNPPHWSAKELPEWKDERNSRPFPY